MKPVICITSQEYRKAENVFSSDPELDCVPVSQEEHELADQIAEKKAFGTVLGVDSYQNELYSSLPVGGIIARFGVGHDGVNKQKATEKGLIVTNTPGVLDDSVAEHALLLMGALARNVTNTDRSMKDKNWSPLIGNELNGKKLLIIGCGPIGCKTAKIASSGFNMDVTGCDIADIDNKKYKTDYGFTNILNNTDNILSEADFVSIHLPSVSSTRHFVNADFLAKMKPGACLINTSRGALVNENDLYDFVKQGKISAALDVFETEPYEPAVLEKDLRELDNLIMTPHIGSSTIEACERMARGCLASIKAAFNKDYEKLQILNPEVLKQLK